jgi:hypothetical protein
MLSHKLEIWIPGRFINQHITPEFLEVCRAYTVPAIVDQYKTLPKDPVEAFESGFRFDPESEYHYLLADFSGNMDGPEKKAGAVLVAANCVCSSLCKKASITTKLWPYLVASFETGEDQLPLHWKFVFDISVDELQNIKTVDRKEIIDPEQNRITKMLGVPQGHTVQQTLNSLYAVIGHHVAKMRLRATPVIITPFTLRPGIYWHADLVGCADKGSNWAVRIETKGTIRTSCDNAYMEMYAFYLKILDGSASLKQAIGYLPEEATGL